MSAAAPPRTLRPYQAEACAAVEEDWATGVERPAVLLPTGTGKTDVIAHLATAEVASGGRVLILAHRSELLDQITARCGMHAPHVRVGRVQAAVNERHYPITVAMIQSLASRRDGEYVRLSRMPQPTLVIVDECHHAVSDGYLAVLRGLGCFGPDRVQLVPGLERRTPPAGPVRALGVTATLTRGDDRGLGDVWQSVAYARDTAWAVREGFLVPPKGRVVVADHVRLDRAKVRRGDYTDGELGKMITQSAAQIVADWVAHGRHADGSARTTAAFCPDLESASALAAEFAAAGVPVGLVTGATPAGERRRLYRDLASGAITVLVSIMVLTEGWDCPRVSCILQCRPTKLPGLYTQIVGRGLRTWTEHERYGAAPKTDCLVLDVVGATRGQKLTTLVDLHETAEYDTSELDDALACEFCGGEHDGDCPAEGLEDLGLGPDGDGEGAGEEYSPAGPGDEAKVYEDMDLLAADSEWTWLRTDESTGRLFFLPVGDRFVYVVPVDGASGVSVGHVATPYPKDPAAAYPPAWIGHGLRLAEAKELAERWASHEPGANLAARSAAWRRGRPTPGQVGYLERLGVDLRGIGTKAQAADALSVALASAAYRAAVRRVRR